MHLLPYRFFIMSLQRRFQPIALSGLGLALLMLSGNLHAQTQQVYQWRDAQGRTHYSSTPPKSGQYNIRNVSNRSSTPTAQAPASTENAQCRQARANLAILNGGTAVQITAEDGSQRTLSAEERASQRRIAESVVANACEKP